MKKLLALGVLIVTMMHAHAQQSSVFDAGKLQLQWQVIANNYNNKQQFKSEFTLTNISNQNLAAGGWKVYFNFTRLVIPATSEGGLEVKHINGDFYSLVPTASFKGLAANQSLKISFLTSAWAVSFTDAPDGFYYVEDKYPNIQVNIPKLKVVPPVKPEQWMRTPKDEVPVATPEWVYQQNLTVKDEPLGQVAAILPTPVTLQANGQFFTLSAQTRIVADTMFKHELAYLKKEVGKMFKVVPPAGQASNLISLQTVSGMAAEAYKLNITSGKITIQASSAAGAFYGIQSLKSLLPARAFAGTAKTIQVPGVEVSDQPRFGYRGMMLDVARNFQTKQQILKVLDLMSLYKLNTLHFHFSDDEGWRLQIEALPELTLVGSQRGHTLTNTEHLQPSYASGPNVHNSTGSGYYSKADFIEILKYAQERHIKVIPEIESPGHARAAVKAMDARYNRLMKAGNQAGAEEYLLRDLQDQSVYKSVQHWDDNVINVSLPSAYRFMETVTDAIIQMYRAAGVQLSTIHFGGDEVPAGVWAKSPAVQKLMTASPEIKSTDDLWYYYFSKIDQILKSRNLYVSGWEEAGLRKVTVNGVKKQVPNADFANRNFHLYVWNNVLGWNSEDLAYQLANAGYPVILSCVTNLYFDLAYQKSFDEPGSYWGGYLDIDKPFKFVPYNYLKNINQTSLGNVVPAAVLQSKEMLTEQGKANIVGIQGQLWSENSRGTERMEYMLLPKLLGLAERAWATDPAWATEPDSIKSAALYQASWSAFCNIVSKKELPRLDYMNNGYLYRIPTPGVAIVDGKVLANVQLPGLIIRYTTNGSEPTATSTIYQAPLVGKGQYKLRTFTSKGRGSRTISVNL